MITLPSDVTHLRKLAAICVRAAALRSDEGEVAALKRMAAEYVAMADKMEENLNRNAMPMPHV
ncbi:MAG: hypothetical protein ACJ8EY_01535 [Sphingomicrobium sp.]